MAISKYTRFGLRADKNLSDLPDSNAALGNILNDFDTETDKFAPEDIKVIDGIRNTGISASDFSQIGNAERYYTPTIINDQGVRVASDIPQIIRPLQTITDGIEAQRVVLGEPPYAIGGEGPSAVIAPSHALRNDNKIPHGSRQQITPETYLEVEGVPTVAVQFGNDAGINNSGYTNPLKGDILAVSGVDAAIPLTRPAGATNDDVVLYRVDSVFLNNPTGDSFRVNLELLDGTTVAMGAGIIFHTDLTSVVDWRLFRTCSEIPIDMNLGDSGLELILDAENPDVELSDEYWHTGDFHFSTGLFPTFQDNFGAIKWQGFLANPRRADFHVTTNGFFIFEQRDKETGEFVPLLQFSAEKYTIDYTSHDAAANRIYLDSYAKKRVTRGQSFVDNDGNKFSITDAADYNFPDDTGWISYSGEPNISGGSLNIEWNIGDMLRVRDIKTVPTLQGENTETRIIWWYPEPTSFLQPKSDLDYGTASLRFDVDDGGRNLMTRYYYWYQTQQLAGSQPGDSEAEFEFFRNNRIFHANNQSENLIQADFPVYVRYEPSLSTSDISRENTSSPTARPKTVPIGWGGGIQFYGVPSGTAVGDYIIWPADYTEYTGTHRMFQIYEYIPGYSTRVAIDPQYARTVKGTESASDAFIKSTLNDAGYTNPGDSQNAYIIKPDGLVGAFHSTAANTENGDQVLTYELSPLADADAYNFKPTDIVKGDLVIELEQSTSSAPQHSATFRKVKEISVDHNGVAGQLQLETTRFAGTATPNSTTSVDTIVLVYAHRGLVDKSLYNQCIGVYATEVTTTQDDTPAVNADVTIDVLSSEGINVGDYVQFGWMLNEADAVISIGTTVHAIASPTSITLRPPTGEKVVRSGKSLNAASTIIFAPTTYAANDNKEPCVIPLNTAPPFEGTDLGLATTSTRPHLVVGGNLDITALKFNAPTNNNDVMTVDAIPDGTSNTATHGLLLKNKTFDLNGTATIKDYWALMK